MDPTEPVALTVDLGGVHKLETLAVAWEFPAKSFVVSVSSDGVKWTEVFATDSNILASTKIALGSVAASKVRVVMHEASDTNLYIFAYAVTPLSMQAHALYGVFQGEREGRNVS